MKERLGKLIFMKIVRMAAYLRLVDEYNNSKVWDDPCETDQGALNEALDTIEKEGIVSLIGPETGLYINVLIILS